MFDLKNIKAVSYIIFHPHWPEKSTRSGIWTKGAVTKGKNLEVTINKRQFYPTSGTVVCSPSSSPQFKPYDKIHFGWPAWEIIDKTNKEISPPHEQNLYCISPTNSDLYAREDQDGQLFTENGFCFLDKIYETSDHKQTKSGIYLGAFKIEGNVKDFQISEVKKTKRLVGEVRHLPQGYTGFVFNVNQKRNVPLSEGVKVMVDETSDVKYSLKGKEYYRTRLSEIICAID